MRKKRIRGTPARKPQRIDADSWYYEFRGKIILICWSGTVKENNRRCTSQSIPWKKLVESAKRCRPEEFKKGSK